MRLHEIEAAYRRERAWRAIDRLQERAIPDRGQFDWVKAVVWWCILCGCTAFWCGVGWVVYTWLH